ncbi:methyltransferase [Streptomyces scabichelini]|uniref:methyltransferase n=1 Tax=Streptomyces scabichelini TaxID=2711217 RepID=UPI001F4946BB|nr:methyltransferase [Streptomyces scabichelini]
MTDMAEVTESTDPDVGRDPSPQPDPGPGPDPGNEPALRAATASLVFGFALSQVSGTVARLGVLDAFDGTVKSAEDLARSTGTDARALRRLLRAAASLGLFAVRDDGRFELAPLGRALGDGEAVRRLTALYGAPSVWRAYGALEDAVRTGKPAFECANGVGLFDALEYDGGLADIMHGAMAPVTAAQVPAIVAAYDFGGLRQLVDVGGGDGALLAAVLAAHPGVRGTLVERSAALRAAPAVLREAGVEDRCTLVEGDFFVSVPPGGDAYLLKNILHNWDDAACVRLLRRCRDAAEPPGRVLVPTLVLPEEKDFSGLPEAQVMALSDIEMMVLTDGRERTLAEYGRLFADAGLELGRAVPLPGLPHHFMLEAHPSGASVDAGVA